MNGPAGKQVSLCPVHRVLCDERALADGPDDNSEQPAKYEIPDQGRIVRYAWVTANPAITG
jgi:hypothetical protein